MSEYICERCDHDEPIADRVYIVDKRIFHEGGGVTVGPDKLILCRFHYLEEINRELPRGYVHAENVVRCPRP